MNISQTKNMSTLIYPILYASHLDHPTQLLASNLDLTILRSHIPQLLIGTHATSKTQPSLLYFEDVIPSELISYGPHLLYPQSLNLNLGKEYEIHQYGNYILALSQNFPYRGKVMAHTLLQTSELLEPLTDNEQVDIAHAYRTTNNHGLAVTWARRLLSNESSLLNDIQQVLSISCYYTRDHDLGLAACQYLASQSKINWSLRNLALSNLQYYLSPLSMTRKIPIAGNVPLLQGFHLSNCSVQQIGAQKYRLNLRTVNFSTTNAKDYSCSSADQIIRTQNYLATTNENWSLEEILPLSIAISCPVTLHAQHVRGLEDVRLFGENYFFATCLEFEKTRIARMAWGTYDKVGLITRLEHLRTNMNVECEKNWLPFIQNDQIHFIYSTTPLRIYRLNSDTAECLLLHSDDLFPAVDWRGSSLPQPFDNGWLYTIHQVQFNSNGRLYYHRLVWLSADFTQGKWSDLFYFAKIGIEFNLALVPSDDGFLFSYTVDDDHPTLGYTAHSTLRSMLKYSS